MGGSANHLRHRGAEPEGSEKWPELSLIDGVVVVFVLDLEAALNLELEFQLPRLYGNS